MKLDNDLLYLVDLHSVQLDETGQTTSSWIHGLPLGEYTHPVFGKLQITADKVKRFADNVKNKVRGIDPSINYNHNNEDVASGWVKDAEARQDGLWLFVEWTKGAVEKLKNKEYRYFSAEYHDKWKDATGSLHQDVLFGGALTNRPYMKNLLPINLSETSVSYAFELVEAISKAQKEKEGEDVDLKKLNELLGLPEGTSEEVAFVKLAEVQAGKAKEGNGEKDDKSKKLPKVQSFAPSEELKRLSEDNPLVASLLSHMENQQTTLKEFQSELRESTITKKLAEFDQSKIILTPVAKDKIHDFLLDAPVELHDQFWDILGMMKSSSGILVELGERAGTSVRYGRSKDSVSLFMDEVSRYQAENKVELAEAMDHISRTQPGLWNEYRQGSYSFQE